MQRQVARVGVEARAETLVEASGLDWTMVRPPAVYGPRDIDMLDLFRAALQESVAAQANVERVAPRRKRERGQRKASGAARKT